MLDHPGDNISAVGSAVAAIVYAAIILYVVMAGLDVLKLIARFG